MSKMENKHDVPSYKEGLNALNAQLDGVMPTEISAGFDQDANRLASLYVSPLIVKAGEDAPLFSLENALGKYVGLADLLEQGPVVLVFYRGGWCPYCNLQLRLYQGILTQIKLANGNLVAVSPQIPDESLNMAEKNGLEFEVLSDPGNKVARHYTTVFKNSEESLNLMKNAGIDFDSFYSDDSQEIPVPAVFIISPNGKIIFAKAESGNYRERVEPADILSVLEKLI
jgi:peroxiredoxin